MSRSETRERLVQATIDLIWTSSYGAVSVDAICERAQVRKGSFYHFFASKDELVVAALDTHWGARRSQLDEIFSPSRPPLERLTRYFAYVVDRQTAVKAQYGRVLGCFHNSVGSECVQRPADVSTKALEIVVSLRRYLETTLRDAQAAGLIPAGDPAQDARNLYAYVQGVLAQARMHDDLELLRTIPQTAFALVGAPSPTSTAVSPAPPAAPGLSPRHP